MHDAILQGMDVPNFQALYQANLDTVNAISKHRVDFYYDYTAPWNAPPSNTFLALNWKPLDLFEDDGSMICVENDIPLPSPSLDKTEEEIARIVASFDTPMSYNPIDLTFDDLYANSKSYAASSAALPISEDDYVPDLTEDGVEPNPGPNKQGTKTPPPPVPQDRKSVV